MKFVLCFFAGKNVYRTLFMAKLPEKNEQFAPRRMVSVTANQNTSSIHCYSTCLYKIGPDGGGGSIDIWVSRAIILRSFSIGPSLAYVRAFQPQIVVCTL